MPRLRGAAVSEGDLSGADVGGLVCLLVDEAPLGLPERHWLAHAEACPCHVATLLAQSVAIFYIVPGFALPSIHYIQYWDGKNLLT